MSQSFHLFFLFLCSILYTASAIGVNWGTTASHPLPPPKVVELLKSNNVSKVKLFDADPLLLQALSGSTIGVTVGIPNSMLKIFNSSIKVAEVWVHDNLTRYLSTGTTKVRIEYVAVGDDPFQQSNGDQFRPFVIGAAINIQTALTRANLASQVKVVVPCSYDSYLSDSGLPSKGHFRPDLNKTMIELLTFLQKHQSPFFVTISPFITFRQNKNISLDFTLFKSARPHNDSHKSYKNSFDLTYDILVNALSTIGFPDTNIIISKIGWPTDGAANATTSVAETFMKGLMDHLRSKLGTPLRPRNPPTATYIYSLLDEDERSIATGNFERHWGLFTFDGQAKYPVDFVGRGLKDLVNAENIEYLPPKWCVVNNNKDLKNASARALDTCSVGDCTALSPGGSCFNISWPANISYAFNSYYQLHDQRPDSCEFGGLGLITSVDPSVGKCRFSIQLQISGTYTLRLPYSSQWMIFLMVTLSFYSMLDNL